VNPNDKHWMQQALKEAYKALEYREVPIGAIVVSEGKLIGRGYNFTEHLKDVTAHAEMQAITATTNYLGGKYLHKCTLYVTLEPCTMCAGALYWTQIDRIVFGATDAKRGAGCFGNLYHPKTKVEHGILEDDCLKVLQTFFQSVRQTKDKR